MRDGIAHFPVFLDLAGKRCLLIGGTGAESKRKETALKRAGARVVRAAAFDPAALDGCTLVMVADAELALAETVSRAARARGIPVNVADRPELCSFIMPAVVDRAPVTVAISTGGTSPVLARRLREMLDAIVPRRIGALAAIAAEYRSLVKRRIVSPAGRKAFWDMVIDGKVAQRALQGDGDGARRALEDALDRETAAIEKRDVA